MKSKVAAKTAPRTTLGAAQQERARALLDPLLKINDDPRLRGKLRYGYRFEGPAVIYFESLPGLRKGSLWVEHDIAKFRFTKTTGLWSLFCQFRDLKWRSYEPLPESDDLAELVEEMQRDPTCIFHG